MKGHITYFVLLLALFGAAHASQAPAVSAAASPPQEDCRQTTDSKRVDASTSLRVTVVACSGRLRIKVDRTVGGKSAETESREFSIPSAGVNEVGAVSKDAFYVNLLEAQSYANPSVRIYHFDFRGGQWLLSEMSFQGTQSCNGEAGVDADYYDVDYFSGKVKMKLYDGCGPYRRKTLAIKPASIPLQDFDPADQRLVPFQYE